MKKEKKQLNSIQQKEIGHGQSILDGDVKRLRAAQRLMDEAASQIPPLTPEQIHALVESDRISQFQLRRQADRYLLIFCLLFLALVASVLLRTAHAGITPLNVALLVLGGMDAWVVLRAARSLWLMRQTLRLRATPLRMARYTDRLNRLSRRRSHWLDFVIRSNDGALCADTPRKMENLSPCVPSYAIAALLLILVTFNAGEAFATTRNYVNVVTTSGISDTAICDTLYHILEQQ